MSILPYLVAIWLFLVGLYGIVTSKHLVHLVVCLTVVQSSTYILLIAAGFKSHAFAPIYNEIPPGSPAVDPVTHALILTDLVVGATVSALLLSLAVQIYRRKGTVDPADLRPLQR